LQGQAFLADGFGGFGWFGFGFWLVFDWKNLTP
jgi:hypothetical protein